jgi:hypothetical protein
MAPKPSKAMENPLMDALRFETEQSHMELHRHP